MKPSPRIHAIDALRGFDMFWIIGGDYLIHYLYAATGAQWLEIMSHQLMHADWVGFRAYDLIFPLFMFLSGVSAGIVLERDREDARKSAMALRAGRRAFVLFLLGVLYNWGWRVEWEEIRFASVLGLIGGAYFISVVIMLALDRIRGQLMALAFLLLLISALQLLAPTPSFDPGVLTPEGSINSWIDQNFLPGRLHGTTYDPEGLLGIISGASITLAGGIIGAHLMVKRQQNQSPDLFILSAVGLTLIAFAIAFWPIYPPIKKIWTATFDILSIGASILLLTAALALFRGRALSGLRTALAMIGANSIVIYFTARYFLYPIYGWSEQHEWPAIMSAGVIVIVLCLEWLLLRFLYQRKLFLRI